LPLFASNNGPGGNFHGFILEYFGVGSQSTFASGVSRPRGVAFDSAGNLFVSTTAYDPNVCPDVLNFGQIVKITPGGVQSVFATMGCDTFPEGLAIDGGGNIFVNVLHNNPPNGPPSFEIYKFTPGGVQSTFASLPGAVAFGLAFDSAGNLYTGITFESGPTQIWRFLPDGTSSVFATASSEHSSDDLAFDRFGNLFVSTQNCPEPGVILEYAPDGTESTFATGLSSPFGLAFDNAGNLFVAEQYCGTGTNDILKFTPAGMRSVFASGITGRLEWLAFRPR
jgi:sugar lactone lactonase YvrE